MTSIIDPAASRWSFSPETKASTQTSQTEIYGADEETLVRLFRSKIKYALADAGFDQRAQDTVSSLVERNVISCGAALHGALTPGGSIQADLVQSQLRDLISGEFQVNSNEVALLILVEFRNQVSGVTMRAVKDASCAVVRDLLNIFPVRVYVAYHTAPTPQVANPCDGISVGLLNVVNTDIGGPSMIQLLDDGAASSDWKKMIVYTEAWNRTDLLWTNDELDRVGSSEVEQRGKDSGSLVECTVINNNDNDGFDDEGSLYGAPVNECSTQENPEAVVTLDDITKVESSNDMTTEESQTPEELHQPNEPEPQVVAQHPAMVELLARETGRLRIQHPTWDHSHGGESLIDLIRRQSSARANMPSDDKIDDAFTQKQM